MHFGIDRVFVESPLIHCLLELPCVCVCCVGVLQFAQSVVQSKHVLVQHGNLNEAPHLDELGL